LQNAVPPHQFGTAVGTMNFSRNLYATMLVAVFGAIVLASLPGAGLPAGGLPVASAEAAAGFSRVFFIAAASMAVAMVCLVLLKERPLQTRNIPDEQPAPR
jgi:hypothetical protein